ncbi:hypothetical protein PIB30_034783, partial [Stylosanthes scabra]|nr:hypothetical protein [Stylosanthes scabra]
FSRFIRTENPWVGDSHSVYIIRLFRCKFKLGKSAKCSSGFFESSISASSSLSLWLYGEVGVYIYYLDKGLYFTGEPKLRRFRCV